MDLIFLSKPLKQNFTYETLQYKLTQESLHNYHTTKLLFPETFRFAVLKRKPFLQIVKTKNPYKSFSYRVSYLIQAPPGRLSMLNDI